MNRREYERLRILAEEEYKRALGELEQRYSYRLQTLDWAYGGGGVPRNGDARQDGRPAPASGRAQRGQLDRLVLQALAAINGEFTVGDLEEQLPLEMIESGAVKRSSLSGALRRLAAAGKDIELVEKGAGKRASRYRKGSIVCASERPPAAADGLS